MASNLPRFIKLPNPSEGGHEDYYEVAMYRGEADGIVSLDGDLELNSFTKIEVEPALINRNYVHLRFTRTNRYLGRNEDGLLVARNTFPVEDTTLPSCTLFQPSSPDQAGLYDLTHVQTGYLVRQDGSGLRFSIRNPPSSPNKLHLVDWETTVKLPLDGYIAFKGDNGKYLQTFLKDGQRYLQFSSDDPNIESAAFRVEPLSNGDYKVFLPDRSRWFANPNWVSIVGSTQRGEWFRPVKVGDNSIALFNTVARLFCSRASGDGLTDCLRANVGTIPNTAKFEVQELVQERLIYHVDYDMDFGRISDEQPYLAGQSVVTNNSSEEAVMAVEITYQDEKSYTFTRSSSVTAGVSSTLEGKIPFIAKGSITVSVDMTETFEWSSTTKITTSITASTSVAVPPRTAFMVSYVGTKGTCSVPFSYTQQDKSSYDGSITRVRKDDGSYTGVNCYNFEFKIEADSTLKLTN